MSEKRKPARTDKRRPVTPDKGKRAISDKRKAAVPEKRIAAVAENRAPAPPRGHAPRQFHGAKTGKREPVKKQVWGPATLLSPVPAVMVSCATKDGRPNIITIAWEGTVCSTPPLISVSIRPERHSYNVIKESGEFVVNLPSVNELMATDYCGVASGRDVDKFEKTGLTAVRGSKVAAPIIAECPVNIECRVRRTIELGSHAMFLAEIVAIQVSDHLVNQAGRLALEKADLTAFAHGDYYALGRKLGHFGYSVKRHKKKR